MKKQQNSTTPTINKLIPPKNKANKDEEEEQEEEEEEEKSKSKNDDIINIPDSEWSIPVSY